MIWEIKRILLTCEPTRAENVRPLVKHWQQGGDSGEKTRGE